MDKSKEYIEMCAGAAPIQKYGDEHLDELAPSFIYDLMMEKVCLYMWIPETMRDKLGLTHKFHIISIEKDDDIHVFIEEGVMGGIIWLPRQDQLQEVVSSTYDQPSTMLMYCSLFSQNKEMYKGIYREAGKGLAGLFNSMEQLWLAFVMHVKYQKIWDGSEWKKKGE